MEKGRLLYETPKQKRGNVYYAISMIVLGIFIISLAIIQVILEEIKVELSFFGVLILLFGGFFFIGTWTLHSHFRLYSNGITEQISPILKLFKDEGRFIPFTKINAFELSEKNDRCIIYLKPKGNIQYLHKPDTINQLGKILRQLRINEIA